MSISTTPFLQALRLSSNDTALHHDAAMFLQSHFGLHSAIARLRTMQEEAREFAGTLQRCRHYVEYRTGALGMTKKDRGIFYNLESSLLFWTR
jgi:hypothetical protein